MNRYHIDQTTYYVRKLHKVSKGNSHLVIKVKKVIEILSLDPFAESLNTHKVNSHLFGIVYASKVTGDLRILWNFSGKSKMIIVLTIGGHSGGSKVYKSEY
ncbi:hypothetical protein HYV12_01620 [Candidatus Dojkabacteria bacterium]|nr:hypothetical protein [Candidatus Dojkabacteria bacterium]